jgi:cysteine desulfurase
VFSPCYFDHNATTPLCLEVLEGMLPWLQKPLNSSSRHEYGRAAKEALDNARQQVALALGASPSEVVFTSNGTEAANLFIKGVAQATGTGFVAVSAVEHPCVLKSAMQLSLLSCNCEQIPVDSEGRVDVGSYASMLATQHPKPGLISVMMANNETGVLQDIPLLAGMARTQGVCFGTDAVQAFGKIPVNFRELNRQGVNALWISAHKIGGPKGVGALALDKRVDLVPQIVGGGQERNLRSGTENVAAIVGFGLACERFVNGTVLNAMSQQLMRDRLESGLVAMGAQIFGQQADRLPNTSFFAFSGIEGETLVGKLDRAGFAVASGSACSSAQPEPSHVLKAMGIKEELAQGSVRVSLGHGNTFEEVEQFLVTLQKTVGLLRTLTAVAVA